MGKWALHKHSETFANSVAGKNFKKAEATINLTMLCMCLSSMYPCLLHITALEVLSDPSWSINQQGKIIEPLKISSR